MWWKEGYAVYLACCNLISGFRGAYKMAALLYILATGCTALCHIGPFGSPFLPYYATIRSW